tara:strand:+ start:1895 stop:2083 length:189 start_codon:yes stop_codon:yes gene_type:complete
MKKRSDPDKNAKMYFFAAAFISFILANYLWFTGNKQQGIYVGIWVPSICAAGTLFLTGRRNG